jgi:hypothetical protein
MREAIQHMVNALLVMAAIEGVLFGVLLFVGRNK